jgi:pimeloyl-ACP methyl ester carboxylesterase
MKTTIMTTLLILAAASRTFAQTQTEAQSKVTYGANASAGKYTDINGVKIYYEIYGEGEPLLLLHGNGGSMAVFSYQIPAFAKHFKVIAVDSRAQGRSTDSADAEITYALMASDMSALISQLHLGAVNVVGWSDGGNIGLELALAHPEQVKKLVTFGANYTHLDYEAPPDNAAAQPDDPRVLSREAAYAAAARSNPPETSPAVHKKLEDLMTKYPNITIAQLKTIRTPTLVAAGDHDAIKLEQTVEIFRALPHAQLWIAPGATHFVLLEQPDLANRIIIAFLTTPFLAI